MAESGDRNVPKKVEDRQAAKLAMIRKKGKPISIHSSYSSLSDMLISRGEEFPSLVDLDSYCHHSNFRDTKLLREYIDYFKIPPEYILKFVEPGERTCHWDPSHLYVYRDTLLAGLRFPIHPFIPVLFADVRINPCQVGPNGWRLILCFLVLCFLEEIIPTVPLFRKIFQFKNSPGSIQGWVYISHRPKKPHIFNPYSLPVKNYAWKDEFLKLEWVDGDWGTLFRSSFAKVSDGGFHSIVLTKAEKLAYNQLIQGGEDRLAWDLLDESVLVKVGLSRTDARGMFKYQNVITLLVILFDHILTLLFLFRDRGDQ